MIGMSFASVPLYRMFCAATGFGGTTQRAETAPGRVAAGLITVSFDAQVAPGLDWEFRPLKRAIAVHPGAQNEVYFRAVNRTAAPVTAQAVYNVTPTKAGIYFDKLQCFCFSSQTLAPGQERRYGGVVLCRSRHPDRSEHPRGPLDHPVLYDVPGARDRRPRALPRRPDRLRSIGVFRKLTDSGLYP